MQSHPPARPQSTPGPGTGVCLPPLPPPAPRLSLGPGTRRRPGSCPLHSERPNRLAAHFQPTAHCQVGTATTRLQRSVASADRVAEVSAAALTAIASTTVMQSIGARLRSKHYMMHPDESYLCCNTIYMRCSVTGDTCSAASLAAGAGAGEAEALLQGRLPQVRRLQHVRVADRHLLPLRDRLQ